MTDPITTGLLITAAAGIIGMFIRIEHRLTKVETTVDYIKENISGCQPPLDNATK